MARPKGSLNKRTLGLIQEQEIAAKSLKELVLPYVGKALQALIDLLDSDNETVKANAANSLLDRGYGKAMQSVESKAVIAVIDQSPLEVARKAAYLLDNAERMESEVKQLN